MLCAGKWKSGEWKIFRSAKSIRGHNIEKIIWFDKPEGGEYMDAQACFGAHPLLSMYRVDFLMELAAERRSLGAMARAKETPT